MATKLKGLTEQADYNDEDESPEDAALQQTQALLQRLDRLAHEQVRKKAMTEQRWLENLRQYWGMYDPTTEKSLAGQQRSKAFVRLTRHKTNGWAARLSDLLFPTDDKNWGIQPTPVPNLIKAAQQAIAVAQKSAQGASHADAHGNPQARDMMLQQAKNYADTHAQTQEQIDLAKERCKSMEAAIDDQLNESRYVIQCRDVIEDGCRLGTGILKGPLTSQRLKREWKEEPIGHWSLTTIPDPMPEFKRVDPWHFFPDMSARTISDAEFTFERHLPTKKDLRRYAKKLGFSQPAVSRLLKEGASTHQPENTDYLALLREMTGEGEAIIDRYVMWEYHGALELGEVALLLRAVGKQKEAEEWEAKDDQFEEFRVIVYFCNNEVLRIAPDYPLDSGETLYSVWNFEKGETSLFGIGVPELIKDSQAAVNGAWRMVLDNAALSVAPQVVIDKTQIVPQVGGDWKLRPGKVWLRSSTNLQAQNKAFETFDVPNNQQQLDGIIQTARGFIDEESSMPTIAQGEQGAASQTLGGMSILFNSANVVFRRVVKSWDDDLTTPTLRRAYDWNMQFNPDPNVKGDMQVDARGSSVLLVREIQSQNLLQIVTNWSVHQVLGPWIKVRDAMVKALQTMMVPPNDVLLTQDEYDQKQQEAEQAAQKNPPPPDPRVQAVQIKTASDEKIAQIRATSAQQVAEANAQSIEDAAQIKAGLDQQTVEQTMGIKRYEIDSKERQKAVDIAVKDRRAALELKLGKDPANVEGKSV